MNVNNQRAFNAMAGLAIGEALSWPAMYHRSYLLPFWTRRIRREIDAASEKDNVVALPVPFSLNQPAQLFNMSPTVNTEWASFTAEILIDKGTSDFADNIFSEWKNLALSETVVKGSVSVQAALNNIRKGLIPPQCGKENPHYFDDSAMARAVPIGVYFAGDPEKAAEYAKTESSVTNSEDGVWAAQAMAAAISILCSGRGIDEALESAMSFLPDSSWIKRTVDDALNISGKAGSVFEVLPELHNCVVNREYSYGNAAPETLAIALTIIKSNCGSFKEDVTLSSSFPKCGQTLPAVVGSLAGALSNINIASESWLSAIKELKGICIPAFAGKNYLTISEKLSNIAG